MRRRSRLPVILLILLVLVGGVVLIDRIAVVVTERKVAANLRQNLSMPSDPQVHITGFPFLTQAAAKQFTDVRLTGTSATLDHVQVDALSLRLTNFRPNDDWSSGTAKELWAEGTVGWGQIVGLTHLPLRYAGGDRAVVTYSTTFMGEKVSVECTAALVFDPASQSITLKDPILKVLGYELSSSMTRDLIAGLVRPIPLELPAGLEVTGLTVTEAGVVLAIHGTDVDFAKLRRR